MMDMNSAVSILRWHLDMGVDEAIGEVPVDRFALIDAPVMPIAPKQPITPRPAAAAAAPVPPASDEMVKAARDLASQAKDLESLRAALVGFDGCGLKKTATHLVFADGNPSARLMLVGDVPGALEDRQGVPLVGPAGELMDRMLASIGVARRDVLIANTVWWRPPGNRTPTAQEVAMCLPFMERLIELVAPDILVISGGLTAKALLSESQAVGRLRGRWFAYRPPALSKPIDATVMFHPDSLLKTPAQKRAAWQDLLMIKEKLNV
ncbi:MAG: uracil-DNA glycosylase [Rhodospirillales bacterium]|nr:uracil-DNA glycosylase [Rhodospirillales bacterium]